jgi:hypothetical protein
MRGVGERKKQQREQAKHTQAPTIATAPPLAAEAPPAKRMPSALKWPEAEQETAQEATQAVVPTAELAALRAELELANKRLRTVGNDRDRLLTEVAVLKKQVKTVANDRDRQRALGEEARVRIAELEQALAALGAQKAAGDAAAEDRLRKLRNQHVAEILALRLLGLE